MKSEDILLMVALSAFILSLGRKAYLDRKYPLSQSAETTVQLDKTMPRKEAVAQALRQNGITLYRHFVLYKNYFRGNYRVQYWV